MPELKVVFSGDAKGLKLALDGVVVGMDKVGQTATQTAATTNQAMGTTRAGIQSISTQLGAMQDRLGGLASLAAGAFSINAILGMANDVSTLSQTMERYNNTLKYASGSNEAYAANTKFLQQTTRELGLDLQSASQQFASLTAAAKGTSLEGAGTRSIFDAVARASTVMGLTADQTAGSLLAVSQMISKGTVSAEELRGQLGERLPGAFQTAARAMGVTTAELGKMLESGSLATDVFLPRFAAQMRQDMGGAVEQAADSVQANLNRVKTDWANLVTTVNNSAFKNETLKGLDQFLTALTGTLQKSKEDFKGWGDTVANVLAFVGDAVKTAVGVVRFVGDTLGGLAAQLALHAEREGKLYGAQTAVQVNSINAFYGRQIEAIKGGMGEAATAMTNGTTTLRDEVQKQRDIIKAAANDPELKRLADKALTARNEADRNLLATKPVLGAAKSDKDGSKPRFDTTELRAYNDLMSDLARLVVATAAKTDGLSKTQERLAQAMASPEYAQYGRQQREQIGYAAALSQAEEDRAAAVERVTKQRRAQLDVDQKAADALRGEITALRDSNAALELHNQKIGLSTDALAALTLKRLDDAIAVQAGIVAENDDIATRTGATAAMQEQINKLDELTRKRTLTAQGQTATKDAERTTKEFEKAKGVIDSVEKVGKSAFLGFLESGLSAAQQVGQSIKRLVLDMLYEMTAKKWFISIGTSIAGSLGFAGAAQAGQSLLGSAGSSALGTNLFTNFGGSIANGVSSIGSSLINGPLSAQFGDFGANLVSSSSAIGNLAGAAGDAFGYLNGFNSLANGQTGKGIGQLVGQYFGGPVGSYLGGELFKNLFGGAFKSSESTGDSAGSFNAAGNLTSDWYRTSNPAADKVVTDLQATYMATAKGLGIGTVGTHFAYGGNTGAQGESPNFAMVGGANGNYFRQGETSLNNDALKLAASRAVFTALQNSDLPKYLKGVFDGVDAGGSSQKQIDAVLTEAAAYKGLHDQMQMLPPAFAQLKDMSFETAHALVTAAGDMGKFNANLSTYYDKYFTAAEKTATTTAAVGKVFGDVGLVMPALDVNARAAFRTLVEGQDLTTDAGRKAYTALMGVAGAFDALVPAAVDTTAAAKVAEEAAKATAKTRQDWQDKLDVLTGKTTSREIELKTLLATTTDTATQALIRQVFAQEDANAATQAAADAATTLANKLRDTLGSLADDAFGLTNDLLTAQGDDAAVAKRNREKYLAEHTAGLSAADAAEVARQYDTNVGLRAQIKSTIDAKNAATALATAQTQAADAASRAAEQLRAAWQGVADGLLNEVKRIRGELDGNGAQSLAQAKGAFDQAIARTVAGDDAAGKALPGLSQALLALEATNATSALALRRAQGRTAASLETAAAIVSARYGLAVPAGTASGYNLAANVPQLDPAPASPAVNLPAPGAAYSAGSSPAGPAAGEWAALLAEVQALRAAVTLGADAAVDTQKIIKRVTRNGDAMQTRVATP